MELACLLNFLFWSIYHKAKSFDVLKRLNEFILQVCKLSLDTTCMIIKSNFYAYTFYNWLTIRYRASKEKSLREAKQRNMRESKETEECYGAGSGKKNRRG